MTETNRSTGSSTVGIGSSVSGCAMKLLIRHCQLDLKCLFRFRLAHFVILSSIDRGSRMNVGRVTRLRSAPGRNREMMCESTG